MQFIIFFLLVLLFWNAILSYLPCVLAFNFRALLLFITEGNNEIKYYDNTLDRSILGEVIFSI